ncbi:phosphoribosylamine--glycine ligase [Candidatus Dependentiae bacterium]|nr:phosphoribosylamine--glycine ligase [Candidatus Dependentiae bacterium]
MNVLILGEGARENSIAWKISQSEKVTEIFWINGNGGTAPKTRKFKLDYLNDFNGLLDFIKDNKIDLVIVGPELPLAKGIVDFLQENSISVFGPNKEASRLETDKAWSKKFMQRYHIPTAHFKVFYNFENASKEIISLNTYPVVLKAAGLAAGKGVKIVTNDTEAHEFIKDVFVKKKFGEQSGIVFEDFLHGPEISVFALTDGYNILNLIPVQDNKQLLDGGKGPNTGGMGAISPVSFITEDLTSEIIKKIMLPTVDGLRDDGILYQGLLYAGLIITSAGPKVLEYNCRFGDPETQVLMRLLNSDIIDLIKATINGTLNDVKVEWKDKHSICLILASEGYPVQYEKGFEITGLDKIDDDDIVVFQAGTKLEGNKLVTAGGRVLSVTCTGLSFEEVRDKVYRAADKIKFKGKYYRKDIGLKNERNDL